MMKKLLILMVAACGGAQKAAPATQPVDDDHVEQQPQKPDAMLTARMLSRLHEAAGCPGKGWCLAADGWSNGQAADIAPGSHVYVGLTVPLVADVAVDKLLSAATFSTMALVNKDGVVKAVITEVPAKSAAAKQMLADAQAAAQRFFAGQAPKVALAAKLHAFIDTFPDSVEHVVTKGGGEWGFDGDASHAELRKSGDFWISVETPTEPPAGVYVSMFTDQISDAP
jgi:hypothetical protein